MMHPTGLIVAVILLIIICQVHVTLASVKVIDLNTNNHEYTLNRRTPILVLFHTQWCYTCKQILPEFLNVAEYVSSPLQIAKIDCDEEYEVCMKYGVTGYPVIQLIVKGSGQMFQGEATAHNLVQYLNEKIGSKFPLPDPPATIDSTLSGVTEMTIESADSDLAAKKATLILYYAPWCGFCQMLTPEYATVGRLASKQKDVQIAKVNCDSASPVCVKQNIHAFPTIKLYLDETKEYFEYNGERVASEIIAFVNQHAKSNIEGGVELVKVPTAMNPEVVVDGITELTSENADKIVSGHKATMIMFYAPWCNYCKALAPIYAQLGPIAKDDEFVTVAKVNCQGHGELCRKYSVHSYPTIKFLPYGSKDAIEYTWNRNIQDLVLFLNQKGGSHLVAPPAPGAPPPKKGAPDEIVPGIIEVTSHNYQAILDGSKNVFIEFYAPWCGHCKHCAPEFAKFGPIMQKNADSGLIIAKVNCDHEGEICGEKYNVWAYPTFRLYHSGNQDQFTPYLGERTIDTFLQFVNGHTGLDLKVIKQQTHWLTRDEL